MENTTQPMTATASVEFDFEFYSAAEHALANFLGTDDIDQDTVELVGDCMSEAVKALPNDAYFVALLEKSSTYVQADMDEDTLADYVAELEEQMEAYDLL